MTRVLHITTHAIQYYVPTFRDLTRRGQVRLTVLFTEGRRDSGYYDSEFGSDVKWSTNLTSGYDGKEIRAGWGHWLRLSAVLLSEFRKGVDVVWLHGYRSRDAYLVIAIAKVFGAKLAVRGDSSISNVRTAGKMLTLRRLFAGAYLRLFDAYLAVGFRNSRFYKFHGCPPERIFPAPFVVDERDLKSTRAEAPKLEAGRWLRSELGLPENCIVALYVGKLIDRKRPGDLIRAVAAYEDSVSGPMIAAVFVGDGALMSDLRELAGRLTVTSIRFAGFRNQNELAMFYEGCDCLVLPSERENFGLVSNEALAFNKPIVCTHLCGCAGDVVRHGQTGYVYRAGDIEGLVRALVLLSSDERRSTFCRNAGEHKKGYSLELLSACLESAFDAVAHGGGRHRAKLR